MHKNNCPQIPTESASRNSAKELQLFTMLFLFFPCPKHSGCFSGKEEPISMFVMSSVQFQGCRRTRGHKGRVLWKIHFKEIFLVVLNIFFPKKDLKVCWMIGNTASSFSRWKGRSGAAGTQQQLLEVAGEWPQTQNPREPSTNSGETGKGWGINTASHQIL